MPAAAVLTRTERRRLAGSARARLPAPGPAGCHEKGSARMSSLQAVLVLVALVAVIVLLAVLLIVFLRRDSARPATLRPPPRSRVNRRLSVLENRLGPRHVRTHSAVPTAESPAPVHGPVGTSAGPATGESGHPAVEAGLAPTTRPWRAEAEALLSKARAEAEEVMVAAGRLRDQASSDAQSVLERAEIQAERLRGEAHRLRDEAANERADLDRRAAQLGQREERLDADRARITEDQRVLEDQRSAVSDLRGHADQLLADRQAELERVAGLSAESARAELLASLESEAKLAAAGVVRDIERRHTPRPTGAPAASSPPRSSGSRPSRPPRPWSACSHLPERRDEGPDHRTRGPQHPRLRDGHRRQPHHRRHARGRAAVAASTRSAARSARLTLETLVLDGRIHPQRIEEVYERARDEVERAVPARRRGRARWTMRHHRPAPGAGAHRSAG